MLTSLLVLCAGADAASSAEIDMTSQATEGDSTLATLPASDEVDESAVTVEIVEEAAQDEQVREPFRSREEIFNSVVGNLPLYQVPGQAATFTERHSHSHLRHVCSFFSACGYAP